MFDKDIRLKKILTYRGKANIVLNMIGVYHAEFENIWATRQGNATLIWN